MSIGKISPIDIAVSGLRAQSLRLKVIGNNIANSETTKTKSGKPYRRQDVVLKTDDATQSGVQISSVGVDLTTQPLDDRSNVVLPVEMMQMMAASRAYQANAAILKRYQAGVDVTLELLK